MTVNFWNESKNIKNKKFEYGIYLLEVIPKHINSIYNDNNTLVLEINPNSLLFVLNFLKNHLNSGFKILSTITAVDYPENIKRFEIHYVLLSIKLNFRIRIKVLLEEFDTIESAVPIYKSANWFEREVWDLFGIFFLNHPDLRRILTDYGFEGFPLRKDFPQTGFVEVRYDDEKKYVIYEPLEITQEYRSFDFNSSWLQVK